MEKCLVMSLPFNDSAWDGTLQAWLSGSINKSTRALILERLSVDTKFREDFCEWIKTLRGEAWASSAEKSGRAA